MDCAALLLLLMVLVEAAVTLGARLCVDLADIDAELPVEVEFSTRMCGEYATFVEDEESADDSSLDVDSAVVVVEEDVVWSELVSDVVAEALVDGEELEDDELDGTLVEDDELAAFDVDELLELELELEEDGFDGAELEDEELAGAELDDAELEVEDDGCAEDEEGGDELLGGLAPFCGLPPVLLP